MIIFTKSHPATQAMSRAAAPADLNEGDIRRNPGEPSAEQAEASSYNKPRVHWQGLTIAIENPAGSVRRGRNRHGVSWEIRMRFDYGEIVGSMGVDGDPVDVYLGPNLDAPMVYVVHQRRVNDWAEYDEDKCMVGFDSEEDAKQAFLSNYTDPRFLGPITAMPVAEFVAKVRATADKPAMIKALLLKTHVAGYTKQDGTFVPPHEDKRQSLQDDLQRQEKWLHEKALELGYSGIEDMLEKDYPAFERLAAQWREQNPVEVAMKSMVLFFKAHVGPYLRGGKIVNLAGYQGRAARAVATPGQMKLFGEPQHTEPTRDLIAEHERLVDVLNSPSHADDKVEAKKQAEELADMKREIGEHDHLLQGLPEGAKWRRGKGRIAGHYGVEVNGEGVGNYHVKPEDAAAEAKQWLANRSDSAKRAADHDAAVGKLRDRLLAGGEATDADLRLLGLRDGASGLQWFIPAAAKVFGISSRAVRPHIADMIRVGHTDMGVKKEFVSPKKALQAIAAGVGRAS